MATYFTIVQYLPDPITDERINIGVIVFGEGVVRSRFLRNWQRVYTFGGENTAFLRDFAKEVALSEGPQLMMPGLPGSARLDEETLKRMAGEWANSIRFTQPRASLQKPDNLLTSIAERYLRQASPQKREFRDRRTAKFLAIVGLRSALQRRGWAAAHYLKPNHAVPGRLDINKFDIAIANGRVLAAADAFSFEVPQRDELSKDLKAIYWAFTDVRERDRDLPLALVALPPKTRSSDLFSHATSVFRGIGADIVTDDQIEGWAEAMAERVPASQSPRWPSSADSFESQL